MTGISPRFVGRGEELEWLSAVLGHPRLSRRAAEQWGRHTGGNPLHAVTLLAEWHPAYRGSKA